MGGALFIKEGNQTQQEVDAVAVCVHRKEELVRCYVSGCPLYELLLYGV